MSSLRKFFISYSHFFTGSMLNLFLGFITFPILTRILTKEEYGILGLVSSTMFFTIAIAKAGLSDGIIRYYERYNETPDRRMQFASTIFLRGLIFSVLTFLLYITVLFEVKGFLNINHRYMACFMIMGGVILLSPLNMVVLNVMRASGRTLFYNAAIFTSRVVSFGTSFFFFIYLIKAFYGFFIGLVVSEVTFSFFLFYWFLSNYKVAVSKVSGSLAIELIKFGFPLLITELSYLLLTYADRYMIAGYKGEAVLGLYSVGYNIASYISNFMTFSLSYAVVPIYVGIYERDGREKTEEFLRMCMHYSLICILPICVGFYAVSEDLFITLASVKYAEAATFSPIILLGSFFLGMNNILNAGLYLEKKSRIILFIMLGGVITNIGLNIFLIPQYGVMGAALATLTACMLTTVFTVLLSYKYIVVKVSIKEILYYAVSSFIMYFIIGIIHTTIVWIELFAKIIIGILIMMLAVLLKEKEIVTRIKSISILKVLKQVAKG